MKQLFLAVLLSLGVSAGAAVLDGIAAKVDDAVITVGDVMEEIRRRPHAQGRVTTEAGFRQLYRETLAALVDRKLILAAAAEKKLDMQEWIVDNRVREIVKDNFHGDLNNLKSLLEQTGTTFEDWRNTVREDLVVQAMRYQIVEKNVVATPGALRREYAANPARYARDATVTVSVILLRPAAAAAAVSTRAEEIFARLEKGESFADLARRFSSDSHAQDGGLWKDVKPEEEFRPEIADAIAHLKVGERSKLIDLDGWGFIVRKDGETAAAKLSFEEACDEIARNVKREESQRAYEDWTKRLRARAYVDVRPMPDAVK